MELTGILPQNLQVGNSDEAATSPCQ